MIDGKTLTRIASRVAEVPGIRAVVLGGSRARGTHHEDSDVDLGLYYDAAHLDVAALTAAASNIVGAPVEVAGPDGWGPWVDGGSWLMVEGTAVDLILRNVDRVRTQRDRALRGEFAVHHQTGHPLGFLDVAYAGEVALCRPLAGSTDLIEELRAGLDPYPLALRDALVEHLGTAEFLAAGAAKVASRGDLAYLQLLCGSALLWCAHAWHAEAGVWVTNEKGLIPAVAALELDTGDFAAHAQAALSSLDSDPTAVSRMQELVASTRSSLG